MTLEIDFSLVRHRESNKVVGFAMVAQGQTEAENMCASLPADFRSGITTLNIDEHEGKLEVAHRRWGTLLVNLTRQDAGELNALLQSDDVHLRVERAGLLSEGFRFNRADIPDEDLIVSSVNGEGDGIAEGIGDGKGTES